MIGKEGADKWKTSNKEQTRAIFDWKNPQPG